MIIMGDFNLTLENRDSVNRNTTPREINCRRILNDIMYDTNTKDCFRQIIPTGGFTWHGSEARQNPMSRLDMILVSSGKATMCTHAENDWSLGGSDHAAVKIWLDVRHKTKRGPGMFKVNGSLLEDPIKLQAAKQNIANMMQQIDHTWDPHMTLEYFKTCIRSVLSQIGQVTSSIEKQQLIQLETTLTNL